MSEVIYKVCSAVAWSEARATGAYEGSADDTRDGFIHFSTREQLEGTLEKHFAGQDDLVLLTVTCLKLQRLRWEPSRDGAFFPHLYGAIPVSAVRSEAPLSRDGGGRHIIPS